MSRWDWWETADIRWNLADMDAEWLAGSTADTAERNLARAFISLRRAMEDTERCIHCHVEQSS